ncbi:MAG: transglycosylase SLT domain-containing protein [Acidobacteriota bacterium]
MTMRARPGRHFSAGLLATAVAGWMLGTVDVPSSIPSEAVVHAQSVLSADDLWLAPTIDPVAPSELARAAVMVSEGRAAEAVPILVRQTGNPALGGYAHLYLGRAHLALGHEEQALTSARIILENTPGGYLGEAALWLLADADEAAGKWLDAARALQALTGLKLASPQQAYVRLGRAAEKARDDALARGAYAKVYYEWPLSAESSDAESGLARLGGPMIADVDKMERARAQILYAGRRYADARKIFQAVRARATGDERWILDLRLAQCDYYLQRYPVAREALTKYVEQAPGPHVEAEYFLLNTLKALGRGGEYVAAVAKFEQTYGTSPLAETALNDLATYYILQNDDASAADVFSQMYGTFPNGSFADRAAWKAGWWAYKSGNFREAIRLFESAATAMNRADYRSAWVYWAARSYEGLSDRDGAIAAYRRVIADYRNSYYGREATRAIQRLAGPRGSVALVSATRTPALAIAAGAVPPNARLIRRLLEAGMYDDAIAEVRKTQAESGNSPMLDATIAYALNRKGELRPAITAMRRAYPQFMAEGGEQLPRRLLSVIFPVAHWDLIQRYAADRRLDPFTVAALVAQESTFQADIKSSANAWGLMQILPATGRRYASRVGVRAFSTARLTDPEVNVRIGTAYFADLIGQFNDVASALAAYNAGESRVVRWRAERPGAPRDEFIDDIPFPETQNYVKRIIGTAEDYRLLYGNARVASATDAVR